MNPGQRLVLGLPGPDLDDSTIELLSEKNVGGIVLFDCNAADRKGLASLLEIIRNNVTPRPFVAVDFEGGRVRRLGKLFSRLGAPAEYHGSFGKLEADCREIASEFGEVGINVNLAPVADLTHTPLNPALEGRTFSPDPDEAAEYCTAFCRGFAGHGVICCLKHFPGLGSAVNDPHEQVAVSCLSLGQVFERDIVPFRAGFSQGADMLMTTHVKITDIENEIGTLSSKTTKLARYVGFTGVIITDDMSMGALKKQGRSLPQMALDALCSGHDLALICHDHDKHKEIIAHLEENVHILERHGHDQSLRMIESVKKRLT